MLNYARRYFPNGQDGNGNNIHFPGTIDGVPFRSQYPPDLKQEEFEQIKYVYDAHTEIFDLSVPEQKIAYNEIIDKCAKGLSILRFDTSQFDAEKKTWVVFCQWLDKYGEPPDKRSLFDGTALCPI